MASFDEVIPPGQVGYVRAKLDTEKLRGPVGKSVVVYTDDPAAPKLLLTIQAEVLGGVLILPYEMISLTNRVRRPQRPTLLVRAEETETEELALDDVTVSVPWLEVTAERLEQPRPGAQGVPPGRPGDWLLTVDWKEIPPGYGRYSETLTFRTGVPRQPEISIPIKIEAQPPVQLSTESVVLFPAANGSAVRETILFTIRRGLDPAQLRVVAEPEALQFELEPSGPRGYKLHLDWTGTDEPQGSVTFNVGPETYRLTVAGS